MSSKRKQSAGRDAVAARIVFRQPNPSELDTQRPDPGMYGINGMLHGCGQSTGSEGGNYVGTFVNGFKQGHGVLRPITGAVLSYNGEFHEGRVHGFAITRSFACGKDGITSYGTFYDGMRNGYITQEHLDGRVLKSRYQLDQHMEGVWTGLPTNHEPIYFQGQQLDKARHPFADNKDRVKNFDRAGLFDGVRRKAKDAADKAEAVERATIELLSMREGIISKVDLPTHFNNWTVADGVLCLLVCDFVSVVPAVILLKFDGAKVNMFRGSPNHCSIEQHISSKTDRDAFWRIMNKAWRIHRLTLNAPVSEKLT